MTQVGKTNGRYMCCTCSKSIHQINLFKLPNKFNLGNTQTTNKLRSTTDSITKIHINMLHSSLLPHFKQSLWRKLRGEIRLHGRFDKHFVVEATLTLCSISWLYISKRSWGQQSHCINHRLMYTTNSLTGFYMTKNLH